MNNGTKQWELFIGLCKKSNILPYPNWLQPYHPSPPHSNSNASFLSNLTPKNVSKLNYQPIEGVRGTNRLGWFIAARGVVGLQRHSGEEGSQVTVLHGVTAVGGSCSSVGVAVRRGRAGGQLLRGG